MINLLLAGATHGDDPHLVAPVRVDSCPVSGPDHADREEAGLIRDDGGSLDQIRIVPEDLGLIKVDAVLFKVRGTFVGVILELHEMHDKAEKV